MSWLSFFVSTVFAAETIISPLSADFAPSLTPVPLPQVSFGQLTNFVPPIPQVLGTAAKATNTVPPPLKPHKKNYTIAVLGDSMVDTLGLGLPHLGKSLAEFYPGVKFTLLNYGAGGTNIDYGWQRLTNDYLYLGNYIPALVSQNPDIVVIESFAYNPFSQEEGVLEHHWLKLAQIVEVLKARLPQVKIVIAATIAPNAKVFGDGAPGLAYDAAAKQQKVATIKKYLENTVRFAQSQKLPLADAYHASLNSNGNGRESYINPGDHIHYSDAGRALFATAVANTIISNRLLE